MTHLIIVWRVTEACALAGPFWAYDKRARRARASAALDEALALGALLRDYARATQRPVLVSWLGGEPLLWPPLWEAARVFVDEYGLRLSATTNGTALRSAAVRDNVARYFSELTLSVDGVGRAHDDLRGQPGLFEQLRSAVRDLRQRHPALLLRANTVLLRETVRDFPRLCETLAEWGIQQLSFNALGGRDRPEFFPDHCLRPADVEWLSAQLPALRLHLAERGLTLLGGEPYLQRLRAFAAARPWPIADCAPGQSFLFINEQGFISPCSFTSAEYGVHWRDVRNLADLPAQLAERQQRHPAPACADCPSTQVFGKFSNSLLLHES